MPTSSYVITSIGRTNNSKASSPLLYVRHSLTAILCIVAASGHVPAWLHVASCNGCVGVECQDESESSASNCQRSCRQRSERSERAETDRCSDRDQLDQREPAHEERTKHNRFRHNGLPHDGFPRDGLPHDGDSCAACQFLACPLGFEGAPLLSPIFETAPGRAAVFSATVDHELWVAAAHPRGPPRLS